MHKIVSALIAAAVLAAEAPQTTNLFYHRTAGVLSGEEGTIELRLNMEREMDSAQGTWDFMFTMIPAQPIAKNARTLLGIYIPPIPDKGLRAVLRDGKTTRSLSVPDFSWTPGTPFIIALSWGKALRLHVNGKRSAEVNEPCAIPDRLIPAYFMIDHADRFSVKAVRIASVERSAAALWKNTEQDFTRDGDTTLLASAGLTRIETGITEWTKRCRMLKPEFSERTTCIRAGDDPVYPLIGFNGSASPVQAAVRIAAVDAAGIRTETSSSVTIPAGSHAQEYAVTIPALTQSGYYRISADITIDGELSAFQNAAAVFPPRTASGTMARWLGQHYEEQFDLSVYEKASLLTLRAGGRNPFMWPRVEPKKGEWDFSLADEFVGAAEKKNIEILGILGWTPRWAGAPPEDPKAIQNKNGSISWKPRSVEEFGNYVYRTVSRYKGRVAYWEIWNEADWHPPAPAFSFTGNTEEYTALLKEAYTQAKRADPSCKVLISGFGLFGDKNMPRDIFALGGGDYFDIFNFHAYAGTAGYQPLKELIAAKKPGTPSWNSEHMWHEMEAGPKRDYLSVASLLWFMEKGVARYYYMGMAEYYFDRSTCSPSIEYWVVGYFQSMLRTCDSFAGPISFPGASDFSVRHALITSGGEYIAAIGSELGEFEITVENGVVTASDLYGNTIVPAMRAGKCIVPVKNITYLRTKEPIRISAAKATSEIPLFVNGSFEETGGDIAMGGLAAGKPLSWTFRDTTSDPEGKIQLSAAARTGKYGISMSSSGKGAVRIFQDVRIPAPGTYTIAGYFRNDSPEQTPKVFLSFFDRSANKVYESEPAPISGTDFSRITYTIEITQVPSMPSAILFGIKSGAGRIVLDDIYFGKGDAAPK